MSKNTEDIFEKLPFLKKIPLEVTVELGRTKKTIEEIKKLGVGKIITLDADVGESVKLFVNGQYFAEGKVVAVEDEIHGTQKKTYGIKILSIISERQRSDKLGEMIG